MPRKPRTKAEMVEYLSSHFRYDTMNSWNRATSYARKIKVYSLGLDRDLSNRAYEMLDVEEAFDDFNFIVREFDRRYSNSYQIWTNGRSGGYLVLGQGGQRPSEHKSLCRVCGQRNFKVADPEPGACGRCGVMERYNYQFPPNVFAQPGRGLDMGEDFSEWSMDDLRYRVDLVLDFDKTCQRAVDAFVEFCKGHAVKDKVIRVPKTIRVAVPA
jgi:ribosomal protein L37E